MPNHRKGRIDDNGRECSHCGEYKYWEEYSLSCKGTNGYNARCKSCDSKKRYENIDEVRERAKEYAREHKEERSAYHKEYRKKNREELKQKRKMYIEANKDKFKLAQQEYQKKNKESVRVQRKIYSTSPALYNTYAENLNGFNYVEEDNNGFLITKCTYCGKKFHPTNKQVSHRLWAINNVSGSENNLYCSNSCKEACPTFWQRKRRKDEKPNIAYETLDPYVRQAVFERDEYKCQKCGKTNNKGTNPLHAHHINPKKVSPMEANDVDNLITLCKKCHIKVHREIEGCGFRELAMCSEEH